MPTPTEAWFADTRRAIAEAKARDAGKLPPDTRPRASATSIVVSPAPDGALRVLLVPSKNGWVATAHNGQVRGPCRAISGADSAIRKALLLGGKPLPPHAPILVAVQVPRSVARLVDRTRQMALHLDALGEAKRKAERTLAIQLHGSGMSLRDIAEIMNVSYTWVAMLLREHELLHPMTKETP